MPRGKKRVVLNGDGRVDIARQVVADLQKKHGEQSAQVGGDGLESEVRRYISTQCPMLDYIIGRPGIPEGRLTTIVGAEGAGKSTLVLHLLHEIQKLGGIGVLADTEHRLWTKRAEDIGVNFDDRCILLRPEHLEQAFDQIEHTIEGVRKLDPDVPLLIALDSLAGTPTKGDLALEYGGAMPATHARVTSLAMRRISSKIGPQRVILVIVNQLRHKIEFGASWGKPKMTSLGEKPLNYHSSLKIGLEASSVIKGKDEKQATGMRVKATVLESRISPHQGWVATFDMDFTKGIDFWGSALDVLVDVGAIEFNNGWYKYADKSFHREDFQVKCEEHPELLEYVREAPLLWEDQEIEAEEDEVPEEEAETADA